jgi:hypothetical protein
LGKLDSGKQNVTADCLFKLQQKVVPIHSRGKSELQPKMGNLCCKKKDCKDGHATCKKTPEIPQPPKRPQDDPKPANTKPSDKEYRID